MEVSYGTRANLATTGRGLRGGFGQNLRRNRTAEIWRS
ncbi:MAG: hypothetical protein RL385_703, partial [Pseudomonadota bacterium]